MQIKTLRTGCSCSFFFKLTLRSIMNKTKLRYQSSLTDYVSEMKHSLPGAPQTPKQHASWLSLTGDI